MPHGALRDGIWADVATEATGHMRSGSSEQQPSRVRQCARVVCDHRCACNEHDAPPRANPLVALLLVVLVPNGLERLTHTFIRAVALACVFSWLWECSCLVAFWRVLA